MRVLLIEDEPQMARLVAANIGDAGYVVDQVGSIGEADAAIAVARYALVLLDRRLPDGDGVLLLPRMRARQPGVPVIILTALDDVADKVNGLDAGADDYLTKPFVKDELLARIRAALRRPGGEATPPIRCGRLTFDPVAREIAVAGEVVILKRRELALIESLIRRVGRVVARETLMSEVYGFDDDIQSNTLDAHISRLRGRLAQLAAGVAIHPVRGIGYMLDAA
jgi:DNA-binding response OmpR family regulator